MPPKSSNPLTALRAEVMSDFDPPPSTMAAQLINHIASREPRRASDQDELKALMLEVSSTENSGVEFVDVGKKLEHKHKLVYVFARSGEFVVDTRF